MVARPTKPTQITVLEAPHYEDFPVVHPWEGQPPSQLIPLKIRLGEGDEAPICNLMCRITRSHALGGNPARDDDPLARTWIVCAKVDEQGNIFHEMQMVAICHWEDGCLRSGLANTV